MDNVISKRNVHIDLLRITACFLIVLSHVSASNCEFLPIESINWKISHLFNSLGHSGTILFLFISGILLLPREYPYQAKKFFRKNFLTLLAAYLCWMIIYHAVGLIQRGDYSAAVLKDALLNILYGKASYHFWYIPMLLGIYLLLPLFRSIALAGEKTVAYLVLLFLSLNILFPTLFFFEFPYKYLLKSFVDRIPFTLVNHYVGYFFMGYLLSLLLSEKRLPRPRLTGMFLVTAGLAGALAGDYLLSIQNSYNSVAMNTLFSLPLCCIAVGIYLFVCSLPVKAAPPVLKVLTGISSLTFGIYMIHPLIVSFASRLFLSADMLSPLVTLPLGAVFSFLCSLLIVFLLSLIPGVRRWLLFLRAKKG